VLLFECVHYKKKTLLVCVCLKNQNRQARHCICCFCVFKTIEKSLSTPLHLCAVVCMCVFACCSLLQCLAVCRSELAGPLHYNTPSTLLYLCTRVCMCALACCSKLQCVPVCCSVLKDIDGIIGQAHYCMCVVLFVCVVGLRCAPDIAHATAYA